MGKFVGQIGRLDIVHGGPDGVADVGIELLQLSDQLLDVGAVGFVFERALFVLLMIALEVRITGQIVLLDQAKRTNHLHWKLIHLKHRSNRSESPLKNQVHQ